MAFLPTSKRVVFDTNALFRFRVRALIADLAQTGTIQPLWSSRTVEELRAVLRARAMPDAEVFLNQFQASIVTPAPLPLSAKGFRDPGDLHVIEAALSADASLIVTSNARDFPLRQLRPLGLDRVSIDAFFAAHATALQSPDHQANDLRRAGLSQTAKAISSLVADRG